ncbi:leucyl/phenylalanyl-tRNA--protein transferase [Erythrobacteraceae bacterium CFH 75059]|uniref:leucyl/phenylalanyl-tRNA--protein transferase n=1 Tax=Qipengyuania thermophila TaxID=2509361 RepID=UPI00101F6432|nr:leucyl/phenylalanyl-tRNA--protein transferase [Qipengyuania thermophila]TCD04811.1 leucyl/phenylalanyl-tRNA--protein transferase [Erythrobacteraceae bacterium CFH 75059]
MHAAVQKPIPTRLLLDAYRSGIFPMAEAREDSEIFWVEPRERAVIPLDGLHLGRSMRRVLARDRFAVTCDTAFEQVIARCAEPRPDQPDSWISRRIEASYVALHKAGHAHSIECWQEGELVGGLYGVAFDRVFCGESMFSRADNASKVALAWLVAAMRRAEFCLLDCQFMTGHLASMGAVPIDQAEYLRRVRAARGTPAMTIADAVAWFQAVGAGDRVGDGAGDGDAAGAVPAGASSPGKLIAQFLTQTS